MKTNSRSNGRGQDWRKGQLKYTREELETRVKQYFDYCDENGRKYTKPGLILYLDISEDTFDNWLNNDGGKYTELFGVLKRAMVRMRDDLEQRGDTMSLFRLKQACYGGYSDRPTEDSGQGIKVAVSFGAGDGKVAIEYGK
ncbi:conserved hypothetical protein [uncultured Eubacteriales bacterium]|uniref:Uncharacterized protein n=1 Tax=uncultured Eubacteriales bacterium TaxID=172733 RepID=A0A212JSB9_9FIRM|nr:conserved hypothetical protein [uncultured Eubacteriales bacterium]